MSGADGSSQPAAGARGGAIRWLWLSLVVLVLDQWTKFVIVRNFDEFDEVVVLPIFNLVRLHNEGAAFSFLSDASGWQRWMFTGLAVAVSLGIVLWLLRLPAKGRRMLSAGLALVLGGALGNVIDRIRWGHVVDFIHMHYGDWYFPAFNIADSAITIGAGLLILDNVLDMRRASQKGAPDGAGPDGSDTADDARSERGP